MNKYSIKIDGKDVGIIHSTNPIDAAKDALVNTGELQAGIITVARETSMNTTLERAYHGCFLIQDSTYLCYDFVYEYLTRF